MQLPTFGVSAESSFGHFFLASLFFCSLKKPRGVGFSIIFPSKTVSVHSSHFAFEMASTFED